MQFSELIIKLGSAVTASSFDRDRQLDPILTGLAPIEAATAGTISYIEGDKFAKFVGSTAASALVLPMNETIQAQASDRGIAWIATKEPRLLFAQVIKVFYQPFKLPVGVHPSAIVEMGVELGENVSIGAHTVIQAGVKIGNDVTIHPNVVVYPDVQIGDRTILHANCTIHERVRLGNDCVIHSGAAIGAEGFGFVPTATGWFKMEQAGYTVLEDGVEIGCNSTVDRPAMGETRIGRDTKLDNLVHVGHGCQIGSNCAIAAQVGLAGGVKVGNGVLLAGQVGVANQVTIGDRAIASSKTGIHSNVDPGEIVSGYPAVSHKLWLKTAAIVNRLPEMYQFFKQSQRN
ncbi:UDP-3-O-(3-hydroxymyristoyl)glucosamine N-acyltransferase [Chamaesiphon minutus]|uniref:UDP-3-O-acylglucosamine N-acyltransferase n=1 Tax=Chamaesiphon minutus (strain ATCC 27169 / PCC 6605) TaxID=1173020 RepID=K9UH15_CHAP6|nr:UDP-3-O-(3-hydroxymyristoyl)glucosamine N-acyltransferase [Chamaesiphon minutus]AFY94105.1 UDP-3-O-(3-hydroxymyristoyl) glucosamine N-acyltransferase [Chamaesiphon minutus PCC 6605]